MAVGNLTSDGLTESAATAGFWSAGDYDRLASYGSAAAAAHLVRFAGVRRGDRVLDVGTGSGIVAITAAREGAAAVGVDPTPELLVRARDNARLAECPDIEWGEGTAERLPYGDATFDVVLSEYAHMFSTEPETATREMLRVLKPGGTLIVGVPGISGYAWDDDHKRFYSEPQLHERLSASGFALRTTFYSPFRSKLLDERLRVYAIYGVYAAPAAT